MSARRLSLSCGGGWIPSNQPPHRLGHIPSHTILNPITTPKTARRHHLHVAATREQQQQQPGLPLGAAAGRGGGDRGRRGGAHARRCVQRRAWGCGDVGLWEGVGGQSWTPSSLSLWGREKAWVGAGLRVTVLTPSFSLCLHCVYVHTRVTQARPGRRRPWRRTTRRRSTSSSTATRCVRVLCI